MLPESATQETEVQAANVVETTTAPEAPKTEASVAPGNEIENVRRELAELKAWRETLSVPSRDDIVADLRKDPALKQSQRDMIRFQLAQQRDEEIDRQTAILDEMVDAGEVDPQVADKRRKAIKRQVSQEFDQKISAEMKSPEPAPKAPHPDEMARVEVQQTLVALGLTPADIGQELNEWMRQHPGARGVDKNEYIAIAVKKAAARESFGMAKKMREQEEKAALETRKVDNAANKPVVGTVPQNGKEAALKQLAAMNKLTRRLTREEQTKRRELMAELERSA